MFFTPQKRGALAGFCLLLMLLASCAYGIVDPIGDVDSDIEQWAPLLSVEEADALFGTPAANEAYAFEGEYFYYVDLLSEESPSNLMIYRYNIETGIAEYACRDSICAHSGSTCPFGNIDGFTLLRAVEDGVIYRGGLDSGVEWYDLATQEHRLLEKEATNCYRTETTIYYDCTSEDPDDPSNFVYELWRIDNTQTGEKTLVGVGSEKGDVFIEPYTLGGEETIVIHCLNRLGDRLPSD